jgi:hypothetical protein
MRDPARIPRICRSIERIWLKCPDLRLGQLIFVLSGSRDPYYLEDSDLEQNIDCSTFSIIHDKEPFRREE